VTHRPSTEAPPPPAEDAAAPRSNHFWTLPNIICIVRFFGSLTLVPIAMYGQETIFLMTALFLFGTDWIDGKIAIWLNQRSVIGARIDSVADATFYGMTGLGVLWLKWSEIPYAAIGIAAALASYAATSGAALYKYGKMPSYHTLGAKACNWLMVGSLAYWFIGKQIWPLNVALGCVTLANLETLYMTWRLPTWNADIPTWLHAHRKLAAAQQAASDAPPP
jgi:cardiolipin synthase